MYGRIEVLRDRHMTGEYVISPTDRRCIDRDTMDGKVHLEENDRSEYLLKNIQQLNASLLRSNGKFGTSGEVSHTYDSL